MIKHENRSVPRSVGFQRVYERVLELFDNDRSKANFWWMSQQESLDNKSPYEMVKQGHGRKIIKILQRCI